MIEIQNNVRTYIDWLSELNPDLDRDELMRLFEENKSINSDEKEDSIELMGKEMIDEDSNNKQNNTEDNGTNPSNQQSD